jgi:hypothetical protein
MYLEYWSHVQWYVKAQQMKLLNSYVIYSNPYNIVIILLYFKESSHLMPSLYSSIHENLS